MLAKNLSIGKKMFLGFGIIILIMLIVIGNSYVNFVRESEAVKWNVHTYEVIQESDELLNSLINMETGARGYVITGNENFLNPFDEGKVSYEEHYNKLKEFTIDNPKQQQRLLEIQNQYEKWLEWENTKIILPMQEVSSGELNNDAIIAVVQSGEGKAMMDNLRSILGEINTEEREVLANRNIELVNMERETRTVMLVGGTLAAIAAAIIASLVIRMIVNPVKVVTNTFKEIAEGDVNLEARLNISSMDELGTMAKYFNIFMTKLKELIQENKNQNWLTVGRAELNEKIKGLQEINPLCQNIISFICRYLDAQMGVIYVKSDNNTFKLASSYAHSNSKNLSDEIYIGEGLVGQSVLEKRTILVTNSPQDYFKITSGLGEAYPKNILITPCIYHDDVECVIELGGFGEFSDVHLEYLEQISETVAISINLVKAQYKTKELLNKTLEQSEELQVQQEELRQNNEELEEQAKILKRSELELQAQQEELKVSNSELEEKTLTLEEQKKEMIKNNRNLIKANLEIEEKAKELEITNKYKSEFLANMSHELRTPLNSILVLSELLGNKKDNTPLTDKQVEYAKTIHSSGENLLKLINDILDLSKVEAGKMDINFEDVNLSELVGITKRLFSPIALQKNLDFKIEVQSNMPEEIVSDNQRIQQIINNLLSNAFKFTHSGLITMDICKPNEKDIRSFNLTSDLSNLVAIKISDTGIGIPLEKQKLIFEPFKQSDGTTSRKYGGTGLGLSISKELASLLGGNIYLSSEEGNGSTFTLIVLDGGTTSKDKNKSIVEDELVIKKDDSDALEYENLSSKNNNIGEGNDKVFDEKIEDSEKLLLIIEDDEDFLKVLSDLASKKGYSVLVEKNGLDGYNLAEKYKPDAILIDIGLPDINGWKIIDRLKNTEETKNIPVHVISGRDNEESNKESKNLVGYVKKPVNLEELYKLFNDIEENISKNFRKILIIDENEKQSGPLCDNLRNEGFNVVISRSGFEAYEILKKEQFDCMILDLKLRDMNGIEFLKKLEEENIIKFPILIHTEENITQDDEAKLKKYVDNIIIKGKRSIERLIDEASLFFNDVDLKLEDKKIQNIKYNHERESSLANKKILIIDDDMRNVFSLSSALEEKGISIVVGRNGAEGIEKLHENLDIDLIIMDVMMPEMDGYTAMNKIRKDAKFQNIPIIAITAKAMKDDRQKCIEAGANDYLTKPIEIDRLISLLRVWLYK